MAEASVDGLRERKKKRTRSTLIEAAADLCLRQCGMITDTWTVLFATSIPGLGTPGNDPVESRIVCERMCASFELFRRSWMPWRAPGANGQPPASAPTG